MEAVWCSKDRKTVITAGEVSATRSSRRSAARHRSASHMALGEDLGVRGMPAIFTNHGDYIGGYLPPAELVKQLDDLKTAAATE